MIKTAQRKLWILMLLMIAFGSVKAQTFIHPGLLQSKEDLERMKKGVAEKQQPIFEGYEVFRDHPQSQSTYKMQGPLAMVGRNPTVGQGIYDADANAAYQNAVMWAITGNQAFADKAKEIVNGWSSTLKSITGRDAVLMAGLGPFKMVNAAEILRYTNAGWKEADIKQTEIHFKTVIYPVLSEFAPFANGNWDSAAMKTVMAIGVFCNDQQLFEQALRYYVDGSGDGRLTNYIINEDGECQESGRDQGHTQLGIAHLGDCCEMAWHQGLNLYAYADNRLLRGFEYTAKFNLGNEVPYTPALDRTGKYFHPQISQDGRGKLRPVYEQIYNHYVNRIGIPAPFTQQAAEKLRPEKQGQPGADHPGFGTLLYTRTASDTKKTAVKEAPAAPAGMIAKGTSTEINLTWVEVINTKNYTVKRALKSGGPYSVIAKNISTTSYSDKAIKPGTLYFYTVSASNQNGESKNAYETGISAGLPGLWKQQDIGEVKVSGDASFNGKKFTLEGAGTDIDSTADQFHFAYIPMDGDGTITARYVPQVSSQLTKTGLMMREALTDDAAHVSLLFDPQSTGQIEAPGWNIKLISRKAKAAATTVVKQGANLTEPIVTYGRLVGYYWLRLVRKNNTFTGFTSADGKNWTEIGSISLPLKKNLLVGLPVCSRLTKVSTTVMFDQVAVKRSKSENN